MLTRPRTKISTLDTTFQKLTWPSLGDTKIETVALGNADSSAHDVIFSISDGASDKEISTVSIPSGAGHVVGIPRVPIDLSEFPSVLSPGRWIRMKTDADYRNVTAYCNHVTDEFFYASSDQMQVRNSLIANESRIYSNQPNVITYIPDILLGLSPDAFFFVNEKNDRTDDPNWQRIKTNRAARFYMGAFDEIFWLTDGTFIGDWINTGANITTNALPESDSAAIWYREMEAGEYIFPSPGNKTTLPDSPFSNPYFLIIDQLA